MSTTPRTTPVGNHFARTAGPRLADDVQTLSRRCDECWGLGAKVIAYTDLGDGVYSVDEDSCTVCHGTGRVGLVSA
jgi:DnaJ-class molecular chaperone